MPPVQKEVIEKVKEKTIEDSVIVYPILVKNTHACPLHLLSGILQPGEEGLANAAEVSCYLHQYMEQVQ